MTASIEQNKKEQSQKSMQKPQGGKPNYQELTDWIREENERLMKKNAERKAKQQEQANYH